VSFSVRRGADASEWQRPEVPGRDCERTRLVQQTEILHFRSSEDHDGARNQSSTVEAPGAMRAFPTSGDVGLRVSIAGPQANLIQPDNSSSSFPASIRSRVSSPSVNQPWISANLVRA